MIRRVWETARPKSCDTASYAVHANRGGPRTTARHLPVDIAPDAVHILADGTQVPTTETTLAATL